MSYLTAVGNRQTLLRILRCIPRNQNGLAPCFLDIMFPHRKFDFLQDYRNTIDPDDHNKFAILLCLPNLNLEGLHRLLSKFSVLVSSLHLKSILTMAIWFNGTSKQINEGRFFSIFWPCFISSIGKSWNFLTYFNVKLEVFFSFSA